MAPPDTWDQSTEPGKPPSMAPMEPPEPIESPPVHFDSPMAEVQSNLRLVVYRLNIMAPSVHWMRSRMGALEKVDHNESALASIASRVDEVEKETLQCPARVAFLNSNLKLHQQVLGNRVAFCALILAGVLALCQLGAVISNYRQKQDMRNEQKLRDRWLEVPDDKASVSPETDGDRGEAKQPGT